MAKSAIPDAHGVLTEPATLKIERVLPGPIERIWAYLTESDMRKKWFASGEMRLEPGASFELVWRNDDLSDVAGQRPPGFPEEHQQERAGSSRSMRHASSSSYLPSTARSLSRWNPWASRFC